MKTPHAHRDEQMPKVVTAREAVGGVSVEIPNICCCVRAEDSRERLHHMQLTIHLIMFRTIDEIQCF